MQPGEYKIYLFNLVISKDSEGDDNIAEGEPQEIDLHVEPNDNSAVSVNVENKTKGTSNYASYNSTNFLIVYFLLFIF